MKFSELTDLYEHLESDAGYYKYSHQIADLFQKLRDLKQKADQIDEADNAQLEVDCFSFIIKNGKLEHNSSGTDDKGQPWIHPDISKFTDQELDYIEDRLGGTSNPILKARYAHVLWDSQKKHKKYARIAVDSYLELIKFYEEKDKEDSEAHNGLDVLKSVENASFTAFKINYRVEDIRSEMNRLVKHFNFESRSAFAFRINLIEHMLKGKAKFPPSCFEGFPKVCLDLGQQLFTEGEFHQSISLFESGEKVDNKLGINTHDWNRRIAESYEGLMNQRNDSDAATMFFCENAIEYYKKISDDKKVQELEKKYNQLRGNLKFQEISQEIDITEHRKKCEEIAEKLADKEPDEIISVLMGDKSLLPGKKDMEERVERINKNTPLTNLFPISAIDQYGHTCEHFTTDEEKKHYKILEQYTLEIQLAKQFLINEVFLKAIEKKKLNIHTIMNFFEKNSWYGKNIPKRLHSNKVTTYNWLNMIAPSLNEYFNQIHAYFSNPEHTPNFVLAMDSLTLKIEGLIRDICALSGITTFYQTKDKQDRIIVREKDINWLLREEPIKNLFDEDDLLFFKFVLVEKAGLNLRHKIAHCLITYSVYNIIYMHLLFLVLLKLGKYDFVKPEETVEEKVDEEE